MQKLTQSEMAEKIGISQGHLSRIFRTGVAGRRTCERIAALIGGAWANYAMMTPTSLEKAIREGLYVSKRFD